MANPGNEDKNGSACLASIRSNSIDCRFHEIYREREGERVVIEWEKRGEKKKGKREAERAIPPGIGQSARLYHRFTRTARQIFDFHVAVKKIQYLPSVFP